MSKNKVRKDTLKRFDFYKFNILNILSHNNLISDLDYVNIKSLTNKKKLEKYILSNLSKQQIEILKTKKVQPFYVPKSNAKILYSFMCSKK